MKSHRYFILNKPMNMVSQFVSSHQVKLLGNLDFNFPEETHAIGRLDQNSEGLLLLTTNKKITRLLFQGPVPHTRTYLVQVKNTVSPETVLKLANGIAISAPNGTQFITTPCMVKLVNKPANLFEVGKPLHENVKTSWLQITLTEGKFHQVRKMVAAVNHKCIRLIRTEIENIRIGDLVQTYKRGPRAVTQIGKGELMNSHTNPKCCMYKLPKSDNMIDDLIITGNHSILVDSYESREDEQLHIANHGRDARIEDKRLLLARLSSKFIRLPEGEKYTYYQFSLDNRGNNNFHYGVWANGVLSESCSEDVYKTHNLTPLN